jgi:hypothetical protein
MLFGSPELASIPVAYDRSAEIYGEGEPADSVMAEIRANSFLARAFGG